MTPSRSPIPALVGHALRTFGDDLGTWRRLRRLSTAQVADRAGISRRTVENLEHGRGASLENTLRVARALGLLDSLAGALDPYATDVGRLRSEEVLPRRVRSRRPSASRPTTAPGQPMITDVRVYVEIGGRPVPAGHLYSHRRRRVESASFGYDESYLASRDAYALDPALPLASGTQPTPVGVALFRACADSAPDRWGRNLIQRAERIRARAAYPTSRSLGEFDLLLGVRDDLRQGALRFATTDDGRFLAGVDTGVPLLTDLPTLLVAADRVEAGEPDSADLATLLRAGSSLGGARPKGARSERRRGDRHCQVP